MGKLVDADTLKDKMIKYGFHAIDMTVTEFVEDMLPKAIPLEEVQQFILNIQKIKDDHNEYGDPINYGTICGILIEGYRLLDKYTDK